MGALTVAVVTKPFKFEGRNRTCRPKTAERARRRRRHDDQIPNERLLSTIDRATSMSDAFARADDVLRQAIQGISDLILVPGLINLDFADEDDQAHGHRDRCRRRDRRRSRTTGRHRGRVEPAARRQLDRAPAASSSTSPAART